MDTPVLFLEGDNENTLVMGIPDVPEWKTVLPRELIWCGDEECCSFSDIEDDVLVYYIVKMGRRLRVATRDKDLANDKDKLAFEMAARVNKYGSGVGYTVYGPRPRRERTLDEQA